MIDSNNKAQMRNAGVTLIELIVVIAIIGVMSGVLVLGISILSNSNGKKAVNTIKDLYSSARTTSMSKAEAATFEIEYSVADRAYFAKVVSANGTVLEKEKIISSPATVTYCTDKSGTQIDVATTPLKVSFVRSTGGMKKINADAYLKTIYIGNKEITFVPDSGRYKND